MLFYFFGIFLMITATGGGWALWIRQDFAIDKLNDKLEEHGMVADPNLKLGHMMFKTLRLAKQYAPDLHQQMKKNLFLSFLMTSLFLLGFILFGVGCTITS